MLRVNVLTSLLISSSIQFDQNESSLPVYLKGIGWKEVEETARQDLRLSNSVIPIHYDFDLSVNVRGYDNSKKSDFSGCVNILLNITHNVNGIELHSMKLHLHNATLKNNKSLKEIKSIQVVQDINRETIKLFNGISIGPTAEATLKICYNGTATSSMGGLMESLSRTEEGMRISLIANTAEPTGARHWFPCFDQPNFKATFQLQVNHPSSLNVYSNSKLVTTSKVGDNRSNSLFKITPILPPYLIGLAVNDLTVHNGNYKDHNIRSMGPFSTNLSAIVAKCLEKLWKDEILEGIPYLAEKTDIIVVEDIMNAFEMPGLIIICPEEALNPNIIIHELAHMEKTNNFLQYFGNLVSTNTFNEVWIKEGMASLYEESEPIDHAMNFHLESLHDLPMQPQSNFFNSIVTTKYFHYPSHPYHKDYLINNLFGNGGMKSFVSSIANRTSSPEVVEEIFNSVVLKPGRPLLIIDRNTTTITIRQTRFHSSYFDSSLRDTQTKYTIPVLFNLNDTLHHYVFRANDDYLTIPINLEDTFEMDQNFFLLWKVFYNYSVHEKEIFVDSITSALEIGIITFNEFITQVNNHLHLLSIKDIMSLKKIGDRITQQRFAMSDEESRQREEKYWNGCIQRNWTVLHSDYQRRVIKGLGTFLNLFCGLDNMADFKRLLRRVSVDNEDGLIRHDDIRLLSHLATLVVPYSVGEFLLDSFDDSSYRSFLIMVPLFSYFAFPVEILPDPMIEKLRHIIQKDKYLAASMNDKFAQVLEKDYIRKNRPKWFNVTRKQFDRSFDQLIYGKLHNISDSETIDE